MEEDKCPECGSPRIEGSMQTPLGVIIGFSCEYMVIKETGEGYYKRPELCKDRQIERLKGLLEAAGDKPTCKTCRNFNFKVSTDYAWGTCLNKEVLASQTISLSLANEVWEHPRPIILLEAISKYARIEYREDTFGCRFHTPWSEEELREIEETTK